MCGIIGYIGKKNAARNALDGLKRLEYRGYDSAGIAGIDMQGNVFMKKSVGKIVSLEKKLGNIPSSVLAIAHTRWATHGEPTVENAHPHTDCKNEIFVVHNGIIENHEKIREALIREGHVFRSQTDTETLAHLIERQVAFGASSIEEAVGDALGHVVGTFGLAVIYSKEPSKLIGARRGSPLLVGLGNYEHILASDTSAILGKTRRVIYLNDNELAVLTASSKKIFHLARSGKGRRKELKKSVQTIDWSVEDSQKGGFDHFMEKEIFEAPQVIANALRGRVVVRNGEVKFGGLDDMRDKLEHINRLVIVACGTSYYAGLVGKYLFETLSGLPTEAVYGSEFRYQPPVIDKNTLVLAISQSGETADTLEAIREAKKQGATTIAIVNVVGSSIAREVHAGIYNYAGPEIAVASTKAFISQLCVLVLSAVYFGRMRGVLGLEKSSQVLQELLSLPRQAQKILKNNNVKIKRIARVYQNYSNFFYIGRKYSWPVALEGALKLKEISYIHAEGYASGEMKHGPIALIDRNFPVIVVSLQDSVYTKTCSNIQELKARNARIIAVVTEGDEEMKHRVDHIMTIPKVSEALSPILSVIPLQLFAYYVAVLKGCDVDKPRNLAKSVTVE